MSDRRATIHGVPTSPHRDYSSWATVGSAASWSLAPGVIHLTAKDINPFVYNFIAYGGLSILLAIFLIFTKSALYNEPLTAIQKQSTSKTIPRLSNARLHLRYLKRRPTTGTHTVRHVTLHTAAIRKPVEWITLPIVWMTVSGLQIAFLAWSTHFVETAIATTVYELWPAFIIYGITRHQLTDGLYRKPSMADERPRRVMPVEQIVLIVIASFGLLIMLGSQVAEIDNIFDLFSSHEAVIRVLLALIAGVLAALNIVGSLMHGRTLYYQLVDETQCKKNRNPKPIEDRGENHKRLLLWLTVLGVTVGRVLSLPFVLAIGMSSLDASSKSVIKGFLGALLIGVLNGIAIVLLRLGNIGSSGPTINALYLMTPAVALAILMGLGITLPRFDLFLIGAILVLAVNILMQMKPTEY